MMRQRGEEEEEGQEVVEWKKRSELAERKSHWQLKMSRRKGRQEVEGMRRRRGAQGG